MKKKERKFSFFNSIDIFWCKNYIFKKKIDSIDCFVAHFDYCFFLFFLPGVFTVDDDDHHQRHFHFQRKNKISIFSFTLKLILLISFNSIYSMTVLHPRYKTKQTNKQNPLFVYKNFQILLGSRE